MELGNQFWIVNLEFGPTSCSGKNCGLLVSDLCVFFTKFANRPFKRRIHISARRKEKVLHSLVFPHAACIVPKPVQWWYTHHQKFKVQSSYERSKDTFCILLVHIYLHMLYYVYIDIWFVWSVVGCIARPSWSSAFVNLCGHARVWQYRRWHLRSPTFHQIIK